jgi:prevent-host-death family protein
MNRSGFLTKEAAIRKHPAIWLRMFKLGSNFQNAARPASRFQSSGTAGRLAPCQTTLTWPGYLAKIQFMIEANMLEAKTKLSQLVEAAERGEQVILKRHGVPVARIVPIAPKKLPFGFLAGQVGQMDDLLLFDSQEEQEDFSRL